MAVHPRRYSQVPWIAQSDLDEGRRAAWELTHIDELVSCWPISRYDEGSSHAGYLIVHATRGNGNDGGTVTLTISDVARYDWYARASLVPVQSNPVRHRYRIDADWRREEGA